MALTRPSESLVNRSLGHLSFSAFSPLLSFAFPRNFWGPIPYVRSTSVLMILFYCAPSLRWTRDECGSTAFSLVDSPTASFRWCPAPHSPSSHPESGI